MRWKEHISVWCWWSGTSSVTFGVVWVSKVGKCYLRWQLTSFWESRSLSILILNQEGKHFFSSTESWLQLFIISPLFHLTVYLSSFMTLLALMRTLAGLFLPNSLWKQPSKSLAVSQTWLSQSLLLFQGLRIHPKVTGHPKHINFNDFMMCKFKPELSKLYQPWRQLCLWKCSAILACTYIF